MRKIAKWIALVFILIVATTCISIYTSRDNSTMNVEKRTLIDPTQETNLSVKVKKDSIR